MNDSLPHEQNEIYSNIDHFFDGLNQPDSEFSSINKDNTVTPHADFYIDFIKDLDQNDFNKNQDKETGVIDRGESLVYKFDKDNYNEFEMYMDKGFLNGFEGYNPDVKSIRKTLQKKVTFVEENYDSNKQKVAEILDCMRFEENKELEEIQQLKSPTIIVIKKWFSCFCIPCKF